MTVTPIIPRQCFACQRWTGENYCEPFVLEEAKPDERLWLCDSCLDAGLAADEDDAYIEAARDGYAISFVGKHLGTYPRLSRALARVSLAAIADGYYPNCWLIGERGDLQRIDYW